MGVNRWGTGGTCFPLLKVGNIISFVPPFYQSPNKNSRYMLDSIDYKITNSINSSLEMEETAI